MFQLLNRIFISSECPYVVRYIQAGLNEQQMLILAAIIRDLDRETARTETGKSKFFHLCIFTYKTDDEIVNAMKNFRKFNCFYS